MYAWQPACDGSCAWPPCAGGGDDCMGALSMGSGSEAADGGYDEDPARVRSTMPITSQYMQLHVYSPAVATRPVTHPRTQNTPAALPVNYI